ncbi:MAG: type II toxin-antitoxin system VapC family toxin [Chloroflexi bacterium]|nr:type II toxin-antitoxin system VapC family toxin [Chloroflexota bacterium]
MNVVDSSGWLEYLSDGTNADFFAPSILDEANLTTPTICIYEVFKRTLAEFGEERALEAAGVMSRGAVADLTRQNAIEAARLSVELKLAMADSIILAIARANDALLWTQDAHFKGIEGVKYVEK